VLCVFAVAGLLAGFDGALWASRYATIDARVAMGFELTVIASVVVGGVAIRGGAGSVLGVALGVLTLLVIQNGLTLVRIDPLWLQGVYGVVILAAVAIDTVVGRRTRAGWRP
jgi:ribose/xylose/arabinose/galactoside ABC-type transport system permease subunit